MERPVYRLRNLQAFLRQGPSEDSAGFSLGMVALVIVVLMLVLAGAVIGGAGRIQLLFLIGIILFAGYRLTLVGNGAVENRETDWNPDTSVALKELRSFNSNGTLEDRIDPEVGDLLDECSAKYLIIQGLLGSAEWNRVEGVKLEAKQAAESALTLLMGDALVISLSGIRASGQARKVFTDRMETPSIKTPMLGSLEEVSAQMDRLHDELQGTSTTDAHETDTFREAIERISEIRKAEEELRGTFNT